MKKIYDSWRCGWLSAALLLLPTAVHAQYTYTTNSAKITITSYTGSSSTVNIPSTINGLPVTSIGSNAFWRSLSVTSVTIPSSVTSIGYAAFFGENLTSVMLPTSVTTIGDYAFGDCFSMTSATIPGSVTSIGSWAFSYCTNLTQVIFQGNAPSGNGSTNAFFADNKTPVSYLKGTKGWTSTFGGRPTALYQLQYWQYPANGWFDTDGGYLSVMDPFGLGGYSMGGWRLHAVADINGDGLADLFWQSADGWVTVWWSNPNGTYQGQSLGNMGAWALCAAADVDGDGIPDLIWQNPSGSVVIWYMNTNGTVRSTGSLGNLGVWKLKGAADVNGDGKADLFFQSPMGDVVLWMSQAGGGYKGQAVGNLGAWQLRAVYAAASAGIAQLYWENPDGWVVIWSLNSNGTLNSSRTWGNIANAQIMAVQ